MIKSTKLAIVLVCGMAASTGVAQQVVVPNSFTNVAGAGGLNTFIRDLGQPRTGQLLMDASELTSIPPGSQITGIEFRLWTGALLPFPEADATWANYDISVGTCVQPAVATGTLATNFVGTPLQVRSGPLTMFANTYPSTGGPPRPFGPVITFTTPFVYTGGHLGIEIRHTGSNIVNTAANNYFLDVAQATETPNRSFTVADYAGTIGAAATYTISRLTYIPGTGSTGACCMPDGSCVTTASSTCTALGGTYQGDGTSCGTVVCPQPPTGACCFFASCSVLNQFQCAAQGGVYQGDGTACGNCPQPSGSMVFALDIRTGPALVAFPLATPAYNLLGPSTIGFAMDFNGDGSTLYMISNPANQLGTLDQGTGAFTPIATISGAGAGELNWGGLAFDATSGVMYGLAGTNLYTVDLTTGSTTFVAAISGVAGALWIDIAIDQNGRMIGHDIATDVMAEIDKTTGVATVLGPTGFAANFAQGMDFDPDSGDLFATIYVGGGVASFCQVNTTTGAATAIVSTQTWTAGGPEFEMAIKGTGGGGCYANCDGSTQAPVLNVNDFVCFQQKFAAGDPYANCDGSTTPPVLNVNDFVCFQQAFAAGCP